MFFIAFLLTHPVWDVTPFLGLCDVLKLISTHTSRVGCDFCQSCWFISKSDFYSHIPCGMWQSPLNLLPPSHDFYSHIPCGMWRAAFSQLLRRFAFLLTHPVWDVTWSLLPAFLHRCKFLLTHPVWDVTQYNLLFYCTCINFYSHIPCGMWLMYTVAYLLIFDFYSHIPCGMWPIWYNLYTCSGCYFYSHIPCGMWHIVASFLGLSKTNFYSHIPCGMWHIGDENTYEPYNFYSHIPCGMWQHTENYSVYRYQISTHTSRVGCDYDTDKMELVSDNFYSHIPCGMWRQLGEMSGIGRNFYSHIPCGMWLIRILNTLRSRIYFYSHIPCGMWPLYIVYFNHIIPIYYRMDL